MMLIKIVSSNPNVDKKVIENTQTDVKFRLTFLDKKEGNSLKRYYGARLDPFIEVTSEGSFVKAFYTEEGDAIYQLIKWLNESKI